MSDDDFKPNRGDRVSPTFCVLPWIHRFTNVGGEVQVCCVSEEYNSNNLDENGIPINISRIHDDEVLMNTNFMKSLRVQQMKGEWSRICERCRITENNGGFSRRQFENATYHQFITRAINDTRPDGGIRVRIRSADYRLGNLCNLACRMCNPRSSSKWIKDWGKIDQEWFGQSESELDQYRRYRYYEDPQIWESFRKQIPYLRHLHFAGGEPMIVAQMILVMRMCIEEGRAKNIWISYNTNMTIIPDEVKELWPHFNHIRIYASVDAYGSLNDYIRFPAKWKTIERNLLDLEQNFEKYGIRLVLINTTVQMYNVTQLDRLFEYLSQFERIIPIPKLVNLHHPYHYRTQVLPQELKTLAKERLLIARAEAEKVMRRRVRMKRYRFYLDLVDEAIEFMESEDRRQLIPSFMRAASSKDALRNENLFEVIPEFNILKNYLFHEPFSKGSNNPSMSEEMGFVQVL